MVLFRVQQTSFAKSQTVHILGSVGDTVICHNYSTLPLQSEALKRNTSTDGHGCVPIKLYSQ